MKGTSTFFLKGIFLIIILVSVSVFLLIYYTFLGTWLQVGQSIEYKNKANDLLNLLLNSPNCLALEEPLTYNNLEINPSETRIISKEKLDSFASNFSDVEPVCARDFSLRYSVKIEKLPLGRLAVPPKKVPDPGDRDIIIVFDSSKSMDGERIDALKKALIQFIKCSDETDRVALVSYSEICNTTIVSPFTQLTPENKIKLANETIPAIKAESGTPLISSLKTAIELMENSSVKQTKMIVFMTDGRESCCGKCLTDGPSCSELTPSTSWWEPKKQEVQDKECDPGRTFCQSFCSGCSAYYNKADYWNCKECKDLCSVGNSDKSCYGKDKFLGTCLCRGPCDNELCKFSKTLNLSYPIFTVGFLVDPQGEKELECVANSTNGTYFYGSLEELQKLFCEIAGGTTRVKELSEVWEFGVNTSSPLNSLNLKFESSTIASIKFENKTQPALVTISLYYGELEAIGNVIDKVCFSGNSLTYNLKITNPTYSKIVNGENFVCQSYTGKEYCQKLYCKNLNMQPINSPGQYILQLNYDKGVVSVKI
jgi:hypothetical protein